MQAEVELVGRGVKLHVVITDVDVDEFMKDPLNYTKRTLQDVLDTLNTSRIRLVW